MTMASSIAKPSKGYSSPPSRFSSLLKLKKSRNALVRVFLLFFIYSAVTLRRVASHEDSQRTV